MSEALAPVVVETGRRSWVPVPEGSPFPLQNLPYGVVRRPGTDPVLGVAIGDHVLDLARAADAGLLDGHLDDATEVCAAGSLGPLLARGRPTWTALRRRVAELLDERNGDARAVGDDLLVRRGEVEVLLPVAVGDYVDFYSSLHHAANVGRIFRPDEDPLPPNWRHLPVGYHGRAATVVVSGTSVTRPHGQFLGPAGPAFGPSTRLDLELELGFVTGDANRLGEPVPVGAAERHVFGLVLVNDWSARDLQAWEYRPLGPFLAKSFATSISGWVVPLDALAPHRVPAPPQEPPPLPYLRDEPRLGFDIELEVVVRSAAMRDRGQMGDVVARSNARHLYWTVAQQLAHATVNGARVRAGDLFATGTISGPEPGSAGSLLELTWNGDRPLTLGDGSVRRFLEDGDEVTLRGWAGGGDRPRIGLGDVVGRVLTAPRPPV